jgi:hypothetical protein
MSGTERNVFHQKRITRFALAHCVENGLCRKSLLAYRISILRFRLSGEANMDKSKTVFKPMAWLAALLLTAVVTGCGSGGGGTGVVNNPAPKSAGAGTGLAGAGHGPAPVVLGVAGNYVILAETLISTTGTTAITGDLGMSPAAATYVQGFGLILDGAGTPPACFSTSSLVTGKIYASTYNTGGCTTPSVLTTATTNMTTAYTDAAGRAPDFTEVGAGNISGMTLPAGTYKWGTGVLIASDVTLTGGANDVWIFEVAQDVTLANGIKVVLAGGALPKNIFWQVAGGAGVIIGTTAHMEGVIMTAKAITVNTGATANSRFLAQSAVTLNANTITQPAP